MEQCYALCAYAKALILGQYLTRLHGLLTLYYYHIGRNSDLSPRNGHVCGYGPRVHAERNRQQKHCYTAIIAEMVNDTHLPNSTACSSSDRNAVIIYGHRNSILGHLTQIPQ